MKISIALATYNGEKYLQEQLDSYLWQVRLPDELIVCDDVSTDNTLNILKEFQQKALFKVTIIKNTFNLGYTKNFEKALSLCTGDLIFFSDQDDVWLSNKLKVVESVFMDNASISLVIHDGELVNEKLEKTNITKLSQIRSGGINEDSFATGTLTAIHKNLLPLVLPFPDNISGGHDGWVHTISRLVNRRIIIEDVLQKLRRHGNNTSQWVVNSLSKLNKAEVLKNQISTKAANSYADRLFYNRSLINAFNQFAAKEIVTEFDFDVKQIVDEITVEYISLNKRQELLSMGFLGRKLRAFLMLLNRDYKYFNGFKSFIRDILR